VRGEVQCTTCGHWLTPKQKSEALWRLRYRQMCDGKIQFIGPVEALTVAHEIYRTKRDSLWPYLCEFGMHWHLGHPKSQSVIARIAEC
jgi:hypothetical protein